MIILVATAQPLTKKRPEESSAMANKHGGLPFFPPVCSTDSIGPWHEKEEAGTMLVQNSESPIDNLFGSPKNVAICEFCKPGFSAGHTRTRLFSFLKIFMLLLSREQLRNTSVIFRESETPRPCGVYVVNIHSVLGRRQEYNLLASW